MRVGNLSIATPSIQAKPRPHLTSKAITTQRQLIIKRQELIGQYREGLEPSLQ